MFENLSSSLQKIFKDLRGYGKLSESNIKEALRDVRRALLEADVQFDVARDFITRVQERCVGTEVLDSVTPGQQVVKQVYDELVLLLGGEQARFNVNKKPAAVMLLGLHGVGKTTTAGKLAGLWKKEGKKVYLAACDIRRPAAVDQLEVLGSGLGVEVVKPNPGEKVPEIGRRAMEKGITEGADIVLFDTGGRLQIEEDLVEELKELRTATDCEQVLLVVDAAMGQESVNVAQGFHEKAGITGLILTKLDGDARGGAALSVQTVVGCPVYWVGTGEKPDDLEPFHPDRMASRILGMGDVLSLVEKAQHITDERELAGREQRIHKKSFNLEDFLQQLEQMQRLGPLENLLEMLPGGANVSGSDKTRMAEQAEGDWKKARAIIRSMTVQERIHPERLNASRKRRVAQGSGTEVQDVNELLKRFNQTKKMARKMNKLGPMKMPFNLGF